MSGKSYTMKEMKTIVEYLTEHKAYNEIRGRKMWMDLAGSKITNRTWQSLKETFLKRILPDIHNPYYKLTSTQISSFQQGKDIETRLNNRLELRSSSKDSNINDDKEKVKEVPGDVNDINEDNAAGEDPIQPDVRESTETLVLENFYETSEELRRDLQSSPSKDEEDNDQQPSKSMRDLLTYSEPLTPMLQTVIDDFVTDDEEEDPKMQIVEAELEEATNTNVSHEKENVTIEISDSDCNDVRDGLNKKKTPASRPSSPDKNEQATTAAKTKQIEAITEKSITLLSETNDTSNDRNGNNTKGNNENSSGITENNSTCMTDTLLPGNQEVLTEKFKKNSQKPNLQLQENVLQENGRKSASSQEAETKTKKIIMSKSTSDIESLGTTSNGKVSKKSKCTLKQILSEELNITCSDTNNEKCENIPIPEDAVARSSPNVENPCLNNVSLYAEQFSSENYTDSDASNIVDDKTEKRKNNKNMKNKNIKGRSDKIGNENEKRLDNIQDSAFDNTHDKNENGGFKNKKKNEINSKPRDINMKNDQTTTNAGQKSVDDNDSDIIMLEWGSDSVKENDKERRRGRDRLITQQRDSSLANMFGFASGGIRSGRRDTKRRKRTMSHSRKHNYGEYSLASSEWTSDSDSEYVSSPTPRLNNRKRRHSKKYLNPRSARILALEEEGRLFVIYNKKVIPIVKNGKIVKNYVNYLPENEDQEESFWKLKYVEEKKKTAELIKLLKQAKEKENHVEHSQVLPVVPTTSQNSNTLAVQEDIPPKESTKTVTETIPAKKAEEMNPAIENEKKNVKIKFIKNNEEVQLEGHWSQLDPILGHVAQLFQKDPDPQPAPPSTVNSRAELQLPEPVVHRKSTEDVIDKVNQREKQIEQEIMERYQKEEVNAVEKSPSHQSMINVTKRKGRPRKISPAISSTSPKMTEYETESTEQNQITGTTGSGENNAKQLSTRRTRTPKKLLGETVESNQATVVKTRRSTSRKSGNIPQNTGQIDNENPEKDIRYKFPSPTPENRQPRANKSKTNTAAKNIQSNTKRTMNVFSSPDKNFIDAMDSTQGYQDSDISPIIKKRKKSRLSYPTQRKRYTTHFHQRFHHTDDLMTSDASNSFHGCTRKTMTFQNSTLRSEIYISESYKMLMNNDPKLKNISKLDKIVEVGSASKDPDVNIEFHDELPTNGITDINNKENALDVRQMNTDDNSSNISLPTSPVLSIVENISISKSLLSSIDLDSYNSDCKQENDIDPIFNDMMASDVDVPMHSVENEYGFVKNRQDTKGSYKRKAAVSETLLNKIDTVNIQDPSLTETLNDKLKDLLLESAKKKKRTHEIKNTGDNGTKNVQVHPVPKNTKSKKRSSTPRKRQSKQKQLTNTEPCIVEEHVETCSRGGRQSCPPFIQITDDDGNNLITLDETEPQTHTLKAKKERRRKDIIKVKISKPKSKTQDNVQKQNKNTNLSDSGINETESENHLLQASNDSVDLIHNHSDTCLNAHECMTDSVKILENSTDSIVSVHSNSAHSDILVRHHTVGNISNNQELYSSDAQDGSDVITEFDFVEPRQISSSAASTDHTPIHTQSSPNSIMTDDLSDEIPEEPIRKKGWYLFTDDEYTNTNFCSNNNKNTEGATFGAKLDQIFLTCAIPDLSTITEVSRESRDSKKDDHKKSPN